jgi:hypothetical protein
MKTNGASGLLYNEIYHNFVFESKPGNVIPQNQEYDSIMGIDIGAESFLDS